MRQVYKQRKALYMSRRTAHAAEIEGPYSASVMVTSKATLLQVKYPVLLQSALLATDEPIARVEGPLVQGV